MWISVVVKDLRLMDEDKDKESSFKDKDKDLIPKNEDKHEDLRIGPEGSSRTRTFLEDNNTDVDVFPSQTNLSMANVVTCEYEADEKIVRHEIS